jgi:1,4-dihydroxy-2-naphthoyl-CoA hydrolase
VVTDYLEHVMTLGLGELAETMGIEILEAGPDRMVGRMPVHGNRQPFGLLHGGASVVLAETLGSIAAAIHGGPEKVPVGIEISATHHRSATSGHVTAEARAISLGRTLATYEILIEDDDARRVCTARLTCLLRDRPSG